MTCGGMTTQTLTSGKLPLADVAFAGLSVGKPLFPHGVSLAKRREVAQRYRNTLVASRRYVVDNEAMDAAVCAGIEAPIGLLRSLVRLRPPHPCTWMEWDNRTAVEAAGGTFSEESSERIGMLVETRDEGRAMFSTTQVIVDKRETYVSPLSIVWFASGLDWKDNRAFDQHVIRTQTGNVGRPQNSPDNQIADVMFLMGSAYRLGDQENRSACEELSQHARFVITPGAGDGLAAALDSENADTARNASQVLHAHITEAAGTWRNVLSVLMLLTMREVTDSETTFRAGKGRRMSGGKSLPFLEHRLATLRVPRAEATERLKEVPGGPRSLRAHDVDAHWRERRSSGDRECEHHWEALSANRAVCANCGRWSWRVRPFQRGQTANGLLMKERLLRLR